LKSLNNYVKLYFYVNGLVREPRCVLKVRIEFGFSATSSILSELYVGNILREIFSGHGVCGFQCSQLVHLIFQ